MKWLILPVILTLNGCAYTVVSTASYIVTGKSVTDHAATVATGADCDTVKFTAAQHDYWCELPREPGTTYNRTAF